MAFVIRFEDVQSITEAVASRKLTDEYTQEASNVHYIAMRLNASNTTRKENEEEISWTTEVCSDAEMKLISKKCSEDMSNSLPRVVCDGNTNCEAFTYNDKACVDNSPSLGYNSSARISNIT